jgi:hypothetical protein
MGGLSSLDPDPLLLVAAVGFTAIGSFLTYIPNVSLHNILSFSCFLLYYTLALLARTNFQVH